MLLDLAAGHDAVFTTLLTSPALLAFLVSFTLVRRRLSNAPTELLRGYLVAVGLFSVLLAVGNLAILPDALQRMPFLMMCLSTPCLMAVMGTSWGVFAAGASLWLRARRTLVTA